MSKPELLFAIKCTRRDIELCELDDAVILAGLGYVAVEAFASRHLRVPDWLLNQQMALDRFIRVKHEEELELKLKRVEAARATKLTVEEERVLLDREIAALKAELGTS